MLMSPSEINGRFDYSFFLWTHLSFMRQNGKGYEKEKIMVVTGHEIKYGNEMMRNKR